MKKLDNHSQESSDTTLTSLVEDYPDLATGLGQFLDTDADSVVASVGIFTLLQLRLRAVLAHLPQVAPVDEPTPGAGSSPNLQ